MPHRLSALPSFTCIDEHNAVDLWPASPVAGYSQCNAIGRQRATDLIEVMRRTSSVVLLTHVFETIAKRGRIDGMEIGFFHGISAELMNRDKIVEFVTVPPERQFRVGRKVGHLAVVEQAYAGNDEQRSAAAAA